MIGRSQSLRVTDQRPCLERQRLRGCQAGLGGHALQVYAMVRNGLCDLRAHAADDAVRSHQADRVDGPEQVLYLQGVRKPVMSMMARLDSVSTIFWSSASMAICVRLESKVPIMGTASTPSHSSMTGWTALLSLAVGADELRTRALGAL